MSKSFARRAGEMAQLERAFESSVFIYYSVNGTEAVLWADSKAEAEEYFYSIFLTDLITDAGFEICPEAKVEKTVTALRLIHLRMEFYKAGLQKTTAQLYKISGAEFYILENISALCRLLCQKHSADKALITRLCSAPFSGEALLRYMQNYVSK